MFPQIFPEGMWKLVAQELQANPLGCHDFSAAARWISPWIAARTRNIAPFTFAMLPLPRFSLYLHVHAMADNSKGGQRRAAD
jgi:hypothetical protein